jgi:hypothetical protein
VPARPAGPTLQVRKATPDVWGDMDLLFVCVGPKPTGRRGADRRLGPVDALHHGCSMRIPLVLILTAVLWPALPAIAQPNVAEQVYESDLAICNGGQMSAPARDACVRDAGRRRDAARGGPPPEIPVSTPDGRATVVTPEGSPPPPTSADAVPSRDGRANVVPAR